MNGCPSRYTYVLLCLSLMSPAWPCLASLSRSHRVKPIQYIVRPSLEKEPRHDCVSCLIHSLPVTTTFAPLHPPPLCVLGDPSKVAQLVVVHHNHTPPPSRWAFLSLSFSAASRRIGAVDVEVVVGRQSCSLQSPILTLPFH